MELIECLLGDDSSDPREHGFAGVTHVVLVLEYLVLLCGVLLVESELPVVGQIHDQLSMVDSFNNDLVSDGSRSKFKGQCSDLSFSHGVAA
jgi:hypothetical protein